MSLTLAINSYGRTLTDPYGMPLYEESPLVIPDGKAAGALVRDDCPGDLGELWRDAFPRDCREYVYGGKSAGWARTESRPLCSVVGVGPLHVPVM